MEKKIETDIEITVRFNEVDSLGIVWHGHYITFFEDGREAFGKEHNLGYLDVFANGFVTPIVQVHCDYKKTLKYGDTVKIHTEYRNSDAAKIIFDFTLYNATTNDLVATGSSTQVFLDKDNFMLQLSMPAFFEDWKRKNGLI